MPTIRQWKCLKCGHRFYPRKEGKPKICPKRSCHSMLWLEPVVKESVDAEIRLDPKTPETR